MHPLIPLLTKALADALAPEHDRTSCSDERTSNGWRGSERAPRCVRCALLIALDDSSEVPDGAVFRIGIEMI